MEEERHFFNLVYKLCLLKLHVIENHRNEGEKTKVRGKTGIVVMTEVNCACN